MKVLGVDFTSTPSRRKPIICVECALEGTVLRPLVWRELSTLADFESLLVAPGPWIAGFDFPFGQSRRFVETIGWPSTWAGYVAHAATLSRADLRATLDDYRRGRAAGDREHRRRTDVAAGAISPQKLYGVPVGLMFHEGATRLLAAGVTVAGLHRGDPSRVAIEAYPGVLVRHLIGRRAYKNDTPGKRTPAQGEARRDVLMALTDGALLDTHGIVVAERGVAAGSSAADPGVDPMGDRIDALLCAVQAGWAWRRRAAGFGAPPDVDPLEGWIAEPTCRRGG